VHASSRWKLPVSNRGPLESRRLAVTKPRRPAAGKKWRTDMTDNIPVASIRRILDYLHEERKDYECEPRDNHIYHSIKAVAEWLRPFEAFSEHFGTCPHCRDYDGWINIGRGHWFYCDRHKVKWCVGSNLFGEWRDETEEQQRAIYEAKDFGSYQNVEPYHPPIPAAQREPVRPNIPIHDELDELAF
jgi:hypothetical protein